VRTVVVYVHGLWMTGLEGVVLRRRLAKELNAATPLFSYPSVRAGVASNALRLAARLQSIRADSLHLVGHSLGGLVILKMFEESGLRLAPGRVVFLGSPVSGSRAAHGLAAWKIGKMVMGLSVREELLNARDRIWTQDRDLGVIAGTLALGLGRIVNRHAAPSDGTVFLDETSVIGMKERLVIRVSHTGLPFSATVAHQTAAFLRSGRFNSAVESDPTP
jgi:triacylglycerol esterase/lipase EstA (alpha/beta hydrolase family)